MESNGTTQQEYSANNINPWQRLLFIILYFLAGMFIGQFLGVLLAMLLFGLGFEQVIMIAENFQSEPNGKYILYSIQFGSALGGFILAPILYLNRYENKGLADLVNSKSTHIIPLALTALLTFSFMVVNSLLIEWNSGIVFPESLRWFEEILQAQEESRHQLTQYLIDFDSFADFLLAFVVVAIIPAIGEELLFRGLIQRNLGKALLNHHLAIWITAFLFSAIHLQFYGLFPRMFLGVIFGYLYYWSGSLVLPILAHFINNGFSLIMVYSFQLGMINEDVTETNSLPNSYILVFLLLGGAGFWYLHRFFTTSSPQSYE